jgi:hypothetical protein
VEKLPMKKFKTTQIGSQMRSGYRRCPIWLQLLLVAAKSADFLDKKVS